jgi:2'-5' RNA ligase
MRTFIAIDFSREIKDALGQAGEHLKYSGADVKWVDKDNIHLTIKFLGEVDEKKIEDVKTALDTVASHAKAFEVTVKGLGAFPKMEFPRVIWVGIDKGAKELTVLAGEIGQALAKLGFEKEPRPFSAHLTIGRVRSPKNKEALRSKMSAYKLPELLPDTINSIILYKSTLTPTGSIYIVIYEANFKC